MYKEISVHLSFLSIDNCRDLGGIETMDGKVIKPGLLLRSASLHQASEKDLLTLQNMGLKHVIDLRTDWEIASAQDRVLKGWSETHLPILHESEISKKEGGQLKAAADLVKNTGRDLTEIYPLMALDRHAQNMWKKFFKALIQQPGSYLFHCTQGKDRTGMAAILILNALGVDEKTIKDEYLETNLYMPSPKEGREFLKKHLPKLYETVQFDLDCYFSARPEYYEALNEAVLSHFGSWHNYLTGVLDLDEKDLDAMKNYYLES